MNESTSARDCLSQSPTPNPPFQNRSHAWFWAALVLFSVLQWLDYRVGFYFEEPLDFLAAREVAAGRLPVIDFTWLYGPVTPILLGALQSFHPFALTAFRLVHLVFALIALAAAYGICRFWMTERFSALVALCAVSRFQSQVFSYTHWLFSAFALVSFWFLLDTLRKGASVTTLRMILLGSIISICIWTKPVPVGFAVGSFMSAALLWTGFTQHLTWKSIFTSMASLVICSFAWTPFFLIEGGTHGVELIRDSAQGILSLGWLMSFKMCHFPPGSSMLQKVMAIPRSEAAHIWFTVVVFVFVAAKLVRCMRGNDQPKLREWALLLGFSAAVNSQALLHGAVHFSDAAAGYSLAPTVILAFCMAGSVTSKRLRRLVLAVLVVWSALFLVRHPMRRYRSHEDLTWANGPLRNILIATGETHYYKALQIALRTPSPASPPRIMLLGWCPSIFVVAPVSDVFSNDIYLARRALSPLYERSPLRNAMRQRIRQALVREDPDFVLILEDYEPYFTASNLRTLLEQHYHITDTIKPVSSFNRITVYRRKGPSIPSTPHCQPSA